MKNNQNIKKVELADSEIIVEIKKHPSMGFIFLKALLISFLRSSTIADNAVVDRTRIVLKNYTPNKDLVRNYRTVCSFSQDKKNFIPISYLQTLFIGLLGKFITSPFFPINPLGLIQISQSFKQKRPVRIDEILDLSCAICGINKTQKGIETTFALEVKSNKELVWQGISTFFTRSPVKRKKTPKKKDEKFLEKKETIFVPTGTGRRYAVVSGDYNPHHQYNILAKLFGFKKAIAHGMWSLARVIASLDKEFDIHESVKIEASFKLPIFMPATTALGFESKTDKDNQQTIINFELRDKQKGLPHLKGRLLNKQVG
ncbi:MAG: hypothetical protein GY699_11455 [Desulfobacteraceae bacterium]|nr:hypothetical protein [Desulfobacteraceae bacterium]